MSTPAPADLRSPRLPPLAWRPVGAALATCTVALAVTSSQYGYHRDELYFRMLEPAWGYVDQPPLTPLLARFSIAVFGDHPWAMRVPAMLFLLGTVLVAALITRELGGGRWAQALCAWGIAFSALPLLFGHVLLTASLDLTVWACVGLFACRALLRGQPVWWLVAGAVVGIGLYNKQLVVLLLLGLAVGLLAVGPRAVLRSGWLWAGVGLALLIGAPNLIYQAAHDWPQLTMAEALSDDESRAMLLPFQVVLLGPPLVAVWLAGLVALWRRPSWRAVRALAVAYPVVLLLTLISGGQIYYPLGLLVVLFAAGAVPTVDWVGRGFGGRRVLVVTAVGVNAVLSALLSLPVVPVSVVGRTPIPEINQVARDSVGWPVYVQTVADVYAGLPAAQRERAVLYTSNYGEAGALRRFGPEHGLPTVYSGHNELWFDGPPPESASVVIAWTQNARGLRTLFRECGPEVVQDNGFGVDNEEQRSVVVVCHDPVGGWAEVWPRVQHYD